MAKRSSKKHKPRTQLQNLVVVTFAEDIEQAKDYQVLLKNNDIPAVVDEDNQGRGDESRGVAVMVPEDYLDEAHVVIESQDAYDDFYDLALEDEDDYQGEIFEDDF